MSQTWITSRATRYAAAGGRTAPDGPGSHGLPGALGHEPPQVEDHVQRGMLYEQQGQYEPAIYAYQRALEMDGENLEAAQRLAFLLEKLNRDAEAAALWDRIWAMRRNSRRQTAAAALKHAVYASRRTSRGMELAYRAKLRLSPEPAKALARPSLKSWPQKGVHVALCARSAAVLTEVAEALRQRHGCPGSPSPGGLKHPRWGPRPRA